MVRSMHTFAELIKMQRKARNWTIYDLALASGVSHQIVSYIERGKGCTMRKAFAIARALGVNAIPVDPE